MAGVVLLLVLVAGGITLIAWELNNATHASGGLNINNRDYLWVVAWKMFLAHPIWGNGPFTYVTQFVQTYSIPPGMMLPHAHNLYINVLGEMGLLGFTAMCFVAGVLVWLVVRLWQAAADAVRMVLVGWIAALAGLAVHNLFDIPTYMPALALIAVTIVALLVSQEQTLPTPRPAASASWRGSAVSASGERQKVREARQEVNVSSRVARVRALAWPALFTTWLIVVLALAWQAWSLQPYFAGVAAANRGDWQTSSTSLDRAVARDPWLALNWFQAGFAHGMLALATDGAVANTAELDLAIQDYRRGLSIESAYATNWANMGLLDWASGDTQDAIQALQKAANLAPAQPAFKLTWGRMLESSGDRAAALVAYRQVLQAVPGWAGMTFFQGSPLRKQAAAEVPGASLSSSPPSPSLAQLTCQVQLDWFESVPATSLVNDLFTLGAAQSDQNLFPAAIKSYEQGFSILGVANSYGIGQGGPAEYTVVAYNRLGIEIDLLPGIDYPVYNAQVIQSMLDLASAYVNTGDTASGIKVYNKVITIDPQNQAAQAHLAELNP